jgi:hypothetical protein
MSIGLVIGLSLVSVIAGITVGILYSYIYIRIVYKKWISLWILLQILFKISPAFKRNNPLKSFTLINQLLSSINSFKQTLSPILIRGLMLSSSGNQQDKNENTRVSSFDDFIKKQMPHSLPEPERDGIKHSVAEVYTQQPEYPVELDKPSLPGSFRHDTLISSGQDEHIHPILAFLNEFEHNREIIREFAGDKLLPLETAFWEAHQSMVSNMAPILKHHLNGLYNDIALLNNLVWLSTEFNRISPNMRTQYAKLIDVIAANLEKMLKVVVLFNQVDRDLVLT